MNKNLSLRTYKQDYYKKIIDKRLDAYLGVEHIIAVLKINVTFDDGVGTFFCSGGEERYNQFIGDIGMVITKSFWLNSEISGCFTEFNVFVINNIDNNIDDGKDKNEEIKRLGIKYRERVRDFRIRFEDYLNRDFKNLYNIDEFMDQKYRRNESQEYPVYKKDTLIGKT